MYSILHMEMKKKNTSDINLTSIEALIIIFFFNEWNEFDFIGSIRSIGENVELVIDPVFVSQ